MQARTVASALRERRPSSSGPHSPLFQKVKLLPTIRTERGTSAAELGPSG